MVEKSPWSESKWIQLADELPVFEYGCNTKIRSIANIKANTQDWAVLVYKKGRLQSNEAKLYVYKTIILLHRREYQEKSFKWFPVFWDDFGS